MRAAAATALLALCGCTIAPHGSRATHTLRTYDPRMTGGLVSVETWTDRSAGGGGQLLTFANLDNLALYHTNSQMQVGGSVVVGQAYVGVDTNAAKTITALGDAAGAIGGAVVGTAARTAVGLPKLP